MANIFRRTQGWKWIPDADPVNSPEGTLLDATNTIPDRLGARSLRLGSASVYSGLQEQRVHSLYTPVLQDVQYRLAGVDDQVYHDGISFGSSFHGSGDILFGDDAYQAFMARGTTKKKFDGTNFNNWGISAPEFPATVVAVNAITSQVATFDSSESPAFTANEGTKAYVDDYAAVANAAMSMTPDATTGRASCTKIFVTPTDFLNIAGGQGGSTDLFDIRSWLQDPRKVDKVTIMFGLNTGADPFVDDFYYFEFHIRNDGTSEVKDADAGSAAAYQVSNDAMLASLTVDEITNLKSPEAASVVLKRLGASVGPQSRERADAQAASPAWGHFAVTRQQFIRVGQTPDLDWTTITGFKVVYTAVPGSTEQIYLDDAIWTGGGNRALTGTFQIGYRFARRLLDDNGNLVYTELSPMSPISDKVVLKQQTAQITIPATSLAGADPQVDTVWVYLYGGWLDTFYRFTITSSELTTGMTIDELSNPAGSNFNKPEERVRLTSHGFTHVAGEGTGSNDLIFTIRKSELEALVENEVFEPGAVGPPDNIISIAGPWNKRMFVLTQEGWVYPSTQKSPACFSLYQTIDLRMYGTPFWIIKTAAGMYAGCSKDIIRIAGTGAESENHIQTDMFAQPLNVSHPPVDGTITEEGDVIMYRSADGMIHFNGTSLDAIPFIGTTLLWKGEARHGISALNTTDGRFRIASFHHNLYMLVPEGAGQLDPVALWKYQEEPEPQWCRFTYPGRQFVSIYQEPVPNGMLLAGTTDGGVCQLETGNTDLGVQIPISIKTPVSDGDNPLVLKDPADFQMHVNTGGSTAQVDFYKNGGLTPSLTIPVATTQAEVYRASAFDLGEFLKIQLVITGSFSTFNMNALNLSVVPRPQNTMVLDIRHIVPDSGTDIAWITQLELDCISSSDLLLDIYKNGVLHTTQPITVNPGVRDVYTVPMPRGTKGRRLRMVFRTTASPGQGSIGFDPYSVKVRHAITGNVTQLPIAQGDGWSAGS
jgi:hypothetical protein